MQWNPPRTKNTTTVTPATNQSAAPAHSLSISLSVSLQPYGTSYQINTPAASPPAQADKINATQRRAAHTSYPSSQKLPEQMGLGFNSSGGHGSSRNLLLVGEVPLHLVALAGGTSLAALLIHGALESTTTTHFLEDTLGVELGLKALQSAIDRFSFTYRYGTHDFSFVVDILSGNGQARYSK